MSTAEKARKARSLETLEVEVREGQKKLARFDLEIEASIVPISSILRSERLRAMVPAPVLQELQAFDEGHR
jgi:multidrug efflux pump subunit AcrA (membrane-fusion protein)